MKHKVQCPQSCFLKFVPVKPVLESVSIILMKQYDKTICIVPGLLVKKYTLIWLLILKCHVLIGFHILVSVGVFCYYIYRRF